MSPTTSKRLFSACFRPSPIAALPSRLNLQLCTSQWYLQSTRVCRNASTNAKAAPRPPKSLISRPLTTSVLAFSLVLGIAIVNASPIYTESTREQHENKPKGKPLRLSEVREHGKNAERKWVTKGTKVYDITDWIPGHPGGDVILRGVGGAIDRYWDIFSIHKKQDVYDILEQYYIGDIDARDLVDGAIPSEDIADPFNNDPKRDPRLQIITQRPFNAETPAEELASFITPNQVFYVRSHLWAPETNENTHTLKVELPDGTEKEYTLEQLKRFEEVQVTATLQCSGNRRKHMSEESRPTNGLQWGFGAISNANWTGVRLRDILADVGFPVDADEWPHHVKHAQFSGAEAYGASIPIEKAVDRRGDVLIAYKMNGNPLPPDHGFPVRVIVPGYVAARSVKWVDKIVLSDEESTSQWQRKDYKCFGPNQGSKGVDWESAPAIQETPVQSAILSIRDISSHSTKDRDVLKVHGLEEDSVVAEGYSYAGGGRRIVRVDVSADDGRTWTQAELLPDDSKGYKAWAWTRWRFVIPKQQAGRRFVVKAVDEANNSQPDHYEAHYNFRGNLTSSWHRVPYRPS